MTNFANLLLSDGSQEMYEWLVERVGFVRTFYATLKSGSTSGAVGRIFITGVSPLLLDDMSSGFNIAINASQDPGLSELADLFLGVSPLCTRRRGSRGCWS